MATASNGTQNRPTGPTATGICPLAIHVCNDNRFIPHQNPLTPNNMTTRYLHSVATVHSSEITVMLQAGRPRARLGNYTVAHAHQGRGLPACNSVLPYATHLSASELACSSNSEAQICE